MASNNTPVGTDRPAAFTNVIRKFSFGESDPEDLPTKDAPNNQVRSLIFPNL